MPDGCGSILICPLCDATHVCDLLTFKCVKTDGG
jgi:hypothetical protein